MKNNDVRLDSRKILGLLETLEMSIEDLATATTKTPQGILYILARRQTKFPTLNKLGDALGVDALDLLTS